MKRVEYNIGTNFRADGSRITPETKESLITQSLNEATQMFTGATLIHGSGVWSPNSETPPLHEECIVISLITDKSFYELTVFGAYLKALWKQEMVLLLVTKLDQVIAI